MYLTSRKEQEKLYFTLFWPLKRKTREQNRNNKRTEIEPIYWFIERIQTLWLLTNAQVKKLHTQELSRNQSIVHFDVMLQHDWPIEQCLLLIRVFFWGKTKSPCFDVHKVRVRFRVRLGLGMLLYAFKSNHSLSANARWCRGWSDALQSRRSEIESYSCYPEFFFLKNWRDLQVYEQKFQEIEKFHVRKVKCLVRATERKMSVWRMETSDDRFDLFIHLLIKQITIAYRNPFSRSYENPSDEILCLRKNWEVVNK